MTTILDVSRRAGVSKTTVSRVMSGKGRISEATKQAVFKAIEELNYRPNVLAQSLTSQTTNSVGLIIPSGYHHSQYIMELMDLAYAMALEQHKFLIITQTESNDLASGMRAIQELVDRRCDGIMYYKTSHMEPAGNTEKLAKLIDELPIPLVVLNHHLPDKPDHCIWMDQSDTESIAVTKLIELGHKKIAYICGPLNINTARQRFQGYKNALNQHHIELDPFLIVEAEPYLHGGYQACQQLLRRKVEFTAIACHSDAIAIGALRALREEKLSVPEDISLFGFDNEDISEYTYPPISTVSLPIREIVQQSCNLLFHKMDHTSAPAHPLTELQGQLIMRGSVKALS